MTKDSVHGVGHSLVFQILLQVVVRVVITSSSPALTSSLQADNYKLMYAFRANDTAKKEGMKMNVI